MQEVRKGSLAVAGAAAVWGTWRLWLSGPALDAAAQGAIILTVAGLIGTAVALREGLPRVSRRTWLLMGAFTLSEAANYLFYFAALGAGDSAAAAVTHYLAPVFVALVAPIVGEKLGTRVPFATPLAFFATLVLVGAGGAEGTTRAAMLGSASAIFYATNIILSKRLATEFSPWALVGLHDLAAAPLVWAFSSTPPWRAGLPELGLALAGALVGGALAAAVYFYGLARVPAPRAAVLAYAEPVAAASVGALFLGEPLGLVKVAAIAVVVFAGALVVTEKA